MILINKLLLLIAKRLFQIWDGLNCKVFQDLHKVVLEELTFYQILKKLLMLEINLHQDQLIIILILMEDNIDYYQEDYNKKYLMVQNY